jgi:hypothetical protein
MFMKRVLIIAAGLSLAGLLMPSNALAAKADGKKAKLIAKYDTNKNGAIDGDERVALRKDFAANPKGDLKVMDADNDGKLTDEEIAAFKPGGGKKTADATKKGNKKAAAPSGEKTSEAEKPKADANTDVKTANKAGQ